MRYFLLLSAFLWSDFDVNRIAIINQLKKEAQTAYLDEDYQAAIETYLFLTDSLQVQDENILLNLSNAYFELNDSAKAKSTYQKLVNSIDPEIQSRAFQQLGVLADQNKQLPAALDMFKESLKANPGNEEARYNYELVKKKLENQPEQQQQDQNNKENQQQEKEEDKEQNQNQDQEQSQDQSQEQQNQEEQDQQQQDQQPQDQQQQDQEQQDREQQQDQQEAEQNQSEPDQPSKPEDGEPSKEQQAEASTAQKLEEMNISEEKAKMILEAMRNAEIQYIQQNQKKAKERTDPKKPDW